MFKHLMNGGSLLTIARFDKEADERAALRARLAGETKVEAMSDAEKQARENQGSDDNQNEEDSDEEGDDEGEEEGEEGEENEEGEGEGEGEKKVEETAEQKAEREKQEKIAAKAKRKQDRMQARIDEATAKARTAEAEVERLKKQLEANPDQKLTAEEIQAQAQALANQAIKEKEVEKLQQEFDESCEKLRKEAKTIDKDFDDKVADMADQFGPIPTFMIGVLSDFNNGGEVLAYLANDDDEAERIYDLKKKPASMAKELAIISLKLEEEKKPKKKQISRVKAIDPVRNNGGRNTQSTVITEADTKNMDSYVAKRIAQRDAQRKARGY